MKIDRKKLIEILNVLVTGDCTIAINSTKGSNIIKASSIKLTGISYHKITNTIESDKDETIVFKITQKLLSVLKEVFSNDSYIELIYNGNTILLTDKVSGFELTVGYDTFIEPDEIILSRGLLPLSSIIKAIKEIQSISKVINQHSVSIIMKQNKCFIMNAIMIYAFDTECQFTGIIKLPVIEELFKLSGQSKSIVIKESDKQLQFGDRLFTVEKVTVDLKSLQIDLLDDVNYEPFSVNKKVYSEDMLKNAIDLVSKLKPTLMKINLFRDGFSIIQDTNEYTVVKEYGYNTKTNLIASVNDVPGVIKLLLLFIYRNPSLYTVKDYKLFLKGSRSELVLSGVM